MAYIDIYNDDKADLTLDEDNIEIILKSVKHKLSGCDIETFKELLDKLKGTTIDDLDVYLTRIYADEDTITSLLQEKAAETLNDFLYEFNLEVVPDGCEARWYHGSEEDEENGVLFEVSIKFKEIGVDSIESYYSHKGNSFKSYYDWDEEGTKELYKGKTFKRNPKRVKESRCFKKGQVFEGRNGRLFIKKQVAPDAYLVNYSDYLLSSLSFTEWTFSDDELEKAIRKVQSGEQLIWDHFQEKRIVKRVKKLI